MELLLNFRIKKKKKAIRNEVFFFFVCIYFRMKSNDHHQIVFLQIHLFVILLNDLPDQHTTI